MKKTNYLLALALAAAPVSLAYAAEGQDSQQWSLTEAAVQQGQGTHGEQAGNAEFVVTGEDFIVKNSGGNTNNIQVKAPSVIFKPHQGEQKGYTNKDFAGLWNSGKQYGQSNPSATLAWRNGQDQYEMIATISNAKVGGKNLTLIAVTGDPQVSYQKNNQPISQDEFITAASKNGKQEIAVWVNETGNTPNTGTGVQPTTTGSTEPGTEQGNPHDTTR